MLHCLRYGTKRPSLKPCVTTMLAFCLAYIEKNDILERRRRARKRETERAKEKRRCINFESETLNDPFICVA